MNDYFTNLLQKYKRRGILIDTNILLVYFVGLYDPKTIPKHARTCAFAIEDFETIASLLEFFEVRVTTTHILTEVSNLLPEKAGFGFYDIFSKAVEVLDEQHLPAKEIAAEGAIFRKFGLTDTGIALLAKGKYLVLTDDLPIFHYLANSGIDVLNFNHIREMNW